LVNVREEHSYPLQISQIVKSAAEKAASQAKAEAKKVKKSAEKKKRGRPKSSKNKDKQEVVLNPELLRIQDALISLLKTIGSVMSLKYVAMDGHFGNYPSAWMVRQVKLHLVSKLRSNAALYPAFEGEHQGKGPKPKYAAKIDFHKMDAKYLRETTLEGNIRTDTYQGTLLNKEFGFALNVVILLKTHLETKAQAYVVLFSTDLELAYAKIIPFYRLRFQIEFNFRDCKQSWGLEDFMNVKETAVTNAATLSFFMVNFSYILLQPFRQTCPEYSVLDLKSHFRGCRYAAETIKMLAQKPDAILLADIFQQIARLGANRPVFQPTPVP
jgi:putative transposase